MIRTPMDPIEAWRDVSARAARATTVRATASVRTYGRARPATAAGFGVLLLAVVIVGIALTVRPGPAPAASTPASGGPVSSVADDGMFRLQLTVPKAHYTDVDDIAPVATLTYLGPDPRINVFHAERPVSFRIQEVNGDRAMEGGTRLPCLSTTLQKDTPVEIGFVKSGAPTGDATRGFDERWYEEPGLRLPAGEWHIFAIGGIETGGCGGEGHPLTASVQVVVTPAVSSSDPVTATADDGTFRLDMTTPRGIYDPGEPIMPVASITYLGPLAETTMYHGGSPILFSIQELGGSRAMGGGMDLPCLQTSIARGEPHAYPFQKGGAIGEAGFDLDWFKDPILRLPSGTWQLRAQLVVETTDGTDGCGGIGHSVTVDNVIVVAGDPQPPAPTPLETPEEPLSPTLAPPEPDDAVPLSDDGTFRLEIAIPKDSYLATEAIEPVATLTYLGPEDLVEYGHASPALFFTIEQLDGSAQMTGGAADLCELTKIGRGESVNVPFAKGGQVGLGFDVAWFEEPVLRLPPGTWRISARFEGYVPGCEIGASLHELRATRVIVVRGSAPSTEPSGPAAATAVEFTRKFVDGISTGHADTTWPFLSPWSQASIGSVTELARILPQRSDGAGAFEIGPASQDLALLGPEFLGRRWDDLVMHADPSRIFVVPVRDPSAGGTATGTMNLVAAPLLDDGSWRIWLDRSGG